ncbi:MAG: hypothetical protein H6732_04150 [Alphaproteobacteria bacterium]|nr:hypothetical protein [Alphaproteobacteria bacterium]
MIASLVLAAVAHAGPAEPAHSDWQQLAPWRTHAVVEHVDTPRHWFTVDGLPVAGLRCEINLPTDRPGAAPQVSCGEPTVGTAGRRATPRSLRAVERRVVEAVAEATDLSPAQVRAGRLVYLGTLQRVSFRQVVVVEPDADAGKARARTLWDAWDVDVDTGRVDPGVVGTDVRLMPLCGVGVHPDCAAPPALLAWHPSAAWDGMLAPEEDLPDGERDALVDAIREVSRQTRAGAWQPASPRVVSDGLLPDAYAAGVGVHLHVQAVTDAPRGGPVRLDLPLASAAEGPVAARLPLDGVDATVEVELRVPDDQLVVRIRPRGGRYVERAVEARCALVREDAVAALPRPCPVAWEGRWLTWTAPDGRTQVAVQLADTLEPLVGPVPAAAVSLQGRPD